MSPEAAPSPVKMGEGELYSRAQHSHRVPWAGDCEAGLPLIIHFYFLQSARLSSPSPSCQFCFSMLLESGSSVQGSLPGLPGHPPSSGWELGGSKANPRHRLQKELGQIFNVCRHFFLIFNCISVKFVCMYVCAAHIWLLPA